MGGSVIAPVGWVVSKRRPQLSTRTGLLWCRQRGHGGGHPLLVPRGKRALPEWNWSAQCFTSGCLIFAANDCLWFLVDVERCIVDVKSSSTQTSHGRCAVLGQCLLRQCWHGTRLGKVSAIMDERSPLQRSQGKCTRADPGVLVGGVCAFLTWIASACEPVPFCRSLPVCPWGPRNDVCSSWLLPPCVCCGTAGGLVHSVAITCCPPPCLFSLNLQVAC